MPGKKGSGESKRVITSEFEVTTFAVKLPTSEAAQKVREYVESVGGTAFVYRSENTYNPTKAAQKRELERALMNSAKAAMAGDNALADELKAKARELAAEYGITL